MRRHPHRTLVACGIASAWLTVLAGQTADIRWAPIPAGRFQMGCVPHDTECRDNEKPRHPVDIAAFRMMTTDVTIAMYRAYADRTRAPLPLDIDTYSRDDLPIRSASWDEAVAFCQAYGGRLPTEAEFEYAARGAVDGAIYAWGNHPTPTIGGRRMANVADEAGKRSNPGWSDLFAGYDDGYAEISPVGTFPANTLGLYDMAGNVWQWTSSLDKPYPYRADDGREDPRSRARRVLRGGSYVTPPRGMRLSYRVPHDPESEDSRYHGFRCAQSGS